MELLKRLKEDMTMGELEVVKELVKIEEDELIINASEIAAKANGAKSIVANILRTLKICGIIDYKSIGARGTYLKILDKQGLKYLANR